MADDEQAGTIGTVTETAPGFVPTTGEAETVENGVDEVDELDLEGGDMAEPPVTPSDGLSLPGVDSWSIIAFVSSLVALFGTWFGTVFSTASQNMEYIKLQSSSSTSKADQTTYFNKAAQDQALIHLGFALAGLVLAAVVLLFWRADRHAKWSRAFGQGAFLLSLVGVVLSVLILTNTVAHITF
jgi:hypothetical protein